MDDFSKGRNLYNRKRKGYRRFSHKGKSIKFYESSHLRKKFSVPNQKFFIVEKEDMLEPRTWNRREYSLNKNKLWEQIENLKNNENMCVAYTEPYGNFRYVNSNGKKFPLHEYEEKIKKEVGKIEEEVKKENIDRKKKKKRYLSEKRKEDHHNLKKKKKKDNNKKVRTTKRTKKRKNKKGKRTNIRTDDFENTKNKIDKCEHVLILNNENKHIDFFRSRNNRGIADFKLNVESRNNNHRRRNRNKSYIDFVLNGKSSNTHNLPRHFK